MVVLRDKRVLDGLCAGTNQESEDGRSAYQDHAGRATLGRVSGECNIVDGDDVFMPSEPAATSIGERIPK